MGLTGYVFCMFYYRFFRKNSKVIGTLRTLGYKDSKLRYVFIFFTLVLTLAGSLLSLIPGYLVSDALIQSSVYSYQVSGLVKSISLSTVLVGLFAPLTFLCLITFLCYGFIKDKEISTLITPNQTTLSYDGLLRAANRLSAVCPTKNKFPMRLALRKPIILLLILMAVTSFSVLFIMAYSLNLSSQKIYESQTKGHNYLFDAHWHTPQTFDINSAEAMDSSKASANDPSTSNTLVQPLPTERMPYLSSKGLLKTDTLQLSHEIISLSYNSLLFQLLDAKGDKVPVPQAGEIVISPMLHELYHLEIGDTVTLTIAEHSRSFVVSQVAFNCKLGSVYVAPSDLVDLLELPPYTYNGMWSIQPISSADTLITHEEKLDELDRSFVSNRSSAVINQVIGCIIGCILLFLALLLNFQDSTRDILILHLMGYKTPAIRRMLIDIYKPIIWGFFILTLYPAIQIVKTILASISLEVGDYMPFQTNLLVLIGIFILLNIVYLFVQWGFNIGIKKILKSDQLYTYISNE